MTEQLIHHAVETIEETGIVEAIEIVNEAIAGKEAIDAKERIVRVALAEGAISAMAVGDLIRRPARPKKLVRSEDPEINRMMIRMIVHDRYKSRLASHLPYSHF